MEASSGNKVAKRQRATEGKQRVESLMIKSSKDNALDKNWNREIYGNNLCECECFR